MNLVSQLAKIEIAQQKKEESEKAKVLSRIFWNHALIIRSMMLFMINDQVEKINKANEAKLHAADEKKAKNLAVVKDKVWGKIYGKNSFVVMYSITL